MSTPKNHHFVPEVYLKEFANSQKQLFCLKKGNTKITSKTVAQVCYKPHYFKIHSEENLKRFNIEDHNHIEKNAFKKHENNYPKLLKKVASLTMSDVDISNSDLALFFEILITIKRRNPTYRENAISHFKNYVTSSRFKSDAEPALELAKMIDTIDPIKYFEKYVETASTDTNKQSDMYLRLFLRNQDTMIQNAVKIFFEHKIFILHAPLGCQFITSDNLGFTQLQSGELFSFGGLGLNFRFFFPLTPTSCLFVSHQHKNTQDKYLIRKNLHAIHTEKETVDIVNSITYQLAIDKVFAYSQGILDRFLTMRKL